MELHLKTTLTIILLASTIIAMSGISYAIQYSDSTSGAMPALPGSQNVAFLEHNMVANGTVVKGSVPFRSVNFPSYWFNANTRELNGEIDFPINSSLKLIFGDSLTLTGNFGSGTGNKLFGAYSLPARADKAIIYSVDMAGDITIYVNDRMTILRPGDIFAYQENETLTDGNGVVKVLYNHTYTNHGLIARNNIKAGMISAREA